MMKRFFINIFIFICIFSCKRQSDPQFSGELIPFKNDSGKWGYMKEYSKQMVIACEYELAYPFVEGVAMVRTPKETGWRIIDTTGSYIYPPECKVSDIDYSKNNIIYAKIIKNNKVGYFDISNKKEIIPCEYDDILIYSNGFIRVTLNEKSGYARKDGTIITPIKYDIKRSDFVHEGFMYVSDDGLDGIIDITGKEIVPTKYSTIFNFDIDANVFLTEGYKHTLVKNLQGKTVFQGYWLGPPGIQSYSDGLMAFIGKNGKYGFIDGQGKLKIPYMYDYTIGFQHRLAIVSKDDVERNISRFAVIDTDNNIVIPFTNNNIEIDSDSLFIFISFNNKSGLYNRQGYELIPMQYDGIERISDHLFKVRQGELYGILNTRGEQIQSFKYYWIEEFSEGMAEVHQKGMGIGYINEAGIEVIKCQYTTASPFKNGAANFQSYQGIGFLDKKGREYWIEYNK